MKIACILKGGSILQIIAGGKRYRFEMPSVPTGGPMVVGKRDEILETQPGSRSAFWVATSLWAKQGKRVCPDGFCLWHPETKYISYTKYGVLFGTGYSIFQPDWCCQGGPLEGIRQRAAQLTARHAAQPGATIGGEAC